MGKSTFLHNVILQDVLAGRGCALLDPHGDLGEELLKYIPAHRRRDVIFFNPLDIEHPIGLNVLERVHPDQRARIADGILSTFQDIWKDNWGPALHELLEHALLAMLDIPGGNWEQDWSALPERQHRERSLSTLNKLRTFISDPILRNIFGQQRSSIDFRRVLDNKQIFIANLDKGQLGRNKSQLLGALLVAKFYLAAITRLKHAELPPFFLYIDEFQSFSTSTFEHILSEARGYGLGLTVAHQYLDQLSPQVLAALKGNVGNSVSFAVGDEDADRLIRSFGLEDPQELINFPPFTTHNNACHDTTANMQPKGGKPCNRAKKAIINNTRQRFAVSRKKVENELSQLFNNQ